MSVSRRVKIHYLYGKSDWLPNRSFSMLHAKSGRAWYIKSCAWFENYAIPHVSRNSSSFKDKITDCYHYTNLTFVGDRVRAGGHGKPFDPS